MDFRNFNERLVTEKKQPKALRGGARRWWQETEDKDAADSAWRQQKALEDQQAYRLEEYVRFARLYGNKDLAGLGIGQYARTRTPDSYKASSSLNVVRSCVDSVQAQTCSSRPRPAFVTDGGDFDQREKGKRLNKFTRGHFYESKYYELSRQVARDAEIFGTGTLKGLALNGRAALERVYVGNLFVDEAEAVWGDPRQLYQVMPIARDVLRGMFPEAKQEAIEDAEAENTDGIQFSGDMVRVVEAWHLPSSPDAKDGKHLICTSAGILGEVDDWVLPRFPFAFQRWADPVVGFWGTGIPEQLLGKQYEINKLAQRIAKMMHYSVPRILVQKGSKIPKNHITNEIAAIVEYEGMIAPTVMAPSFVPAEYFKRLEDLKREAFEEVGVSQMMASGTKPAGLNSAVAQREHADIQSARFVEFGQKYEQLALDTARILLDVTRDIANEADEKGNAKGYSVRMPDKKMVEAIDWLDIDLEEDKYVIQVFPVSSLPSTPAARQETVSEWEAKGWVDKAEARRLLDFPDLEQSSNLAVAALDDIDRTVDHILSGKGYLPPDPHQDLNLGIQRCMSAYLRGRVEEYPPERLELLQNWILQAKAMLGPPPAPPAPPMSAGGPPALPPGDPAAPPTAPPLAA
jgi:hypothetical protein